MTDPVPVDSWWSVIWMSLYFSVAVWLSIALIHAPAFKARLAAPGRAPLPAFAPATRS